MDVKDPTFSDFNVLRPADSSSVVFQNAMVAKTVYPHVVFSWHSPTASGSYDMENAVISSYQVSGSLGGDTLPDQSVSFNFGRLTWTFTDSSGTTSGSSSP